MTTPSSVAERTLARREAAGENVATSVAKALTLLDLLGRSERDSARLSSLAVEAGLPKSTAYRLLKVLEGQGFIDRVGSRYELGGKFFELAMAAQGSSFRQIQELAAPALEGLAQQTGLTVALAVLAGQDVLFLEKVVSRAGPRRLPARVGDRVPATCTALGKALLAFHHPDGAEAMLNGPLRRLTPYSVVSASVLRDQLRTARDSGVARDLEECWVGLSSVAVPILHGQAAVAAVSLSGSSQDGHLLDHVTTLRHVGGLVSKQVAMAFGRGERTRAGQFSL